MGAYLVWFPRAKVFTLFFVILVWFREIEALVVLLVWLALQFLFNRGGDVAWMAHVAGFGFGMMVVLLLRPRARPRSAIRGTHRRARTSEAPVGEDAFHERGEVVRDDRRTRLDLRDVGATGATIPESTRPKSHPRRTANKPSVSGRSPTISRRTRQPPRDEGRHRAWGFPAIRDRRRPSPPRPGSSRHPAAVLRRRIGRVVVRADDRAPACRRTRP